LWKRSPIIQAACLAKLAYIFSPLKYIKMKIKIILLNMLLLVGAIQLCRQINPNQIGLNLGIKK